MNEGRRERVCWKASTIVLAFCVVILIIVIGRAAFISDQDVDTEFGIFTSKPSYNENNEGRKAGDLQNVSIILRSTSPEYTKRWLSDIKKQRKSTNDLPIYVYPINSSLSAYKVLKKMKEPFDNVKIIQSQNGSALIADVLKSPQLEYFIAAEDTQFIGADFADYYFFGQKVLKLDKKIECVCGGSDYQNKAFFQPSQGDVFWLMDTDHCRIGHMMTREMFQFFETETYQNGGPPTCIRPEVPRISSEDAHVTKMSWNVAKMNPSRFTIGKFKERMNFDLKNAKPMQKLDWEDLKRMDENHVYKFPFSGHVELEHYFEKSFQEVIDSKMYDSTIPLFVDGRKVYIVPIDKEYD